MKRVQIGPMLSQLDVERLTRDLPIGPITKSQSLVDCYYADSLDNSRRFPTNSPFRFTFYQLYCLLHGRNIKLSWYQRIVLYLKRLKDSIKIRNELVRKK